MSELINRLIAGDKIDVSTSPTQISALNSSGIRQRTTPGRNIFGRQASFGNSPDHTTDGIRIVSWSRFFWMAQISRIDKLRRLEIRAPCNYSTTSRLKHSSCCKRRPEAGCVCVGRGVLFLWLGHKSYHLLHYLPFKVQYFSRNSLDHLQRPTGRLCKACSTTTEAVLEACTLELTVLLSSSSSSSGFFIIPNDLE